METERTVARAKAREQKRKKEKRQGCHRLDRIVHRGNNTPALTTSGR
jgi:hypothetical protein